MDSNLGAAVGAGARLLSPTTVVVVENSVNRGTVMVCEYSASVVVVVMVVLFEVNISAYDTEYGDYERAGCRRRYGRCGICYIEPIATERY